MNYVLQEWQNMNGQIRKMTKNMPISIQSKINDMVYQKLSSIMQIESLSLVYGKNGEQLYEKTPDVMNYIVCQKSGLNTLISRDDSKLIATKNFHDKFNTDFINYGSLPNIEQLDVKYGMDIYSDFESNNTYLYKVQAQQQRKDEILQDGITQMKIWFNSIIQDEFLKLDKNFSGKLK